jgi:glycosyltransferase involved in cell wall biosynthesis
VTHFDTRTEPLRSATARDRTRIREQTMREDGHARPLRIAQVAPLYESVPPRLYGGTERVVSYLTEQLVADGHEVTLFASGDSETDAELVAMVPRGLRLARCTEPLAHYYAMFEEVYRRADDFDLIHFHVDYLHFPITRRERTPHLTTIHSRLDLADVVSVYREFAGMPVVSISNAQRRPLPWLTWLGTVYHGVPVTYPFHGSEGDHLVFIGRISPEKRVDRAIEIARRAGMKLRIAAKVGDSDRAYYETEVAPLLEQPDVEFVGEIGERDKPAFLGNARAMLFPIDWPEPFGMVMIEAMACGTPVIAFPCGSVPEIINDGVSGFICDDVEQAVRAVERLPEISRAACRAEFERRFTAERMAHDYVRIYRRLVDARRDHPDRRPVLHPSHKLSSG